MAFLSYRKFSTAFALMVSAAAASLPAKAENFFEGIDPNLLRPRHALVIAVPTVRNAAGFQELKNPVNDAAAVTKALEGIGFMLTQNLTAQVGTAGMTRQTIKNALYDFAAQLKGTDAVGLVYFAGHGIERDDGRRYLVPYDALVRYERDLDDELIPVDLIHDAFREAGNPLNFLILDTCRNNPFGGKLPTFGAGLEIRVGKDLPNVVILSSTLRGDVAADGAGNLSPFARAFIDGIMEWDQYDSVALNRISGRTKRYAGPDAASYQVGELVKRGESGDFIFASSRSSYDLEKTAWEKLTRRQKISDYEYKEHQMLFRGGYFYAAAAEARAELLHGSSLPMATLEAVPKPLTLIGPGYRIRNAPAGKTIDFTPPKEIPVLPSAPPVSDPQTGQQWWPVPTAAGLGYAASNAFRNLPDIGSYVTVPIDWDTIVASLSTATPGAAGEAKAIHTDPANPGKVLIWPKSPPVTRVTIPVGKLDSPGAKALAWSQYLDKAYELEKSGVDLSHATLEFVERTSAKSDPKTVAQISYWAGTHRESAQGYVKAVPVDTQLFQSLFGVQ